MEQDHPNLYPLWWIIDEQSKQVLIRYQRKYFRKAIGEPDLPLDEIPVDYAKEMEKSPSRSRE